MELDFGLEEDHCRYSMRFSIKSDFSISTLV